MPNILDAVVTDGAGATFQPSNTKNSGDMGVVQFQLTNTATVKLEGSLDNVNFIDVSNDFAATGSEVNDGERVALMPFMRANVTAHTSGTVSAWLEF